ncbi:MAG: MotA/TolQ/ExbB proton channel family protein [Nitrospirae bacterium]|nr:MotA/TolQ/ExbB proton channel family protein [Nitrospirota bacterium]
MFTDGMSGLFQSLGTISIIVLFVLFCFSVFSWGIIVSKWKTFKAGDEEEKEFLRAYERHPSEYGKIRGLANNLSGSPSAAVFLSVINRIEPMNDLFSEKSELGRGGRGRIPQRSYLEKVVQFSIQNHLNSLEAYLPFLATTGNITPFIGLLGTVLGVINAFQEIGVQGTASLGAVAPGIAEALVATAAGLFAAIPAVIGYNYFLTRIRKIVFHVEAFSIEYLNDITEEVGAVNEVEAIR